ncbi:MAG: nickel pincer cofactor biosynthesis protein LarC [Nitrososphaeraceae archaeon]|nr:nickel pincer cofactor biosynthesis protein LarC [Nitrososphaeraceae archaeon]
MSKITVIDPQISGISGDMLLSALVDAGAESKKIIDSIYNCENYIPGTKLMDVRFEKISVNGFKATKFFVQYKDKMSERRGLDMYNILASCCEKLNLNQRTKIFSLNSLKTLLNAESRIHGEPLEKIHLHEISNLDTFIDLIGCSIALEDLKIFDSKVVTTHISVGNGLTSFSHGTISNPTNAVLEIFKGKTFVLAGNNLGEITTPTGAAILVNLASECVDYYPKMIPERIGLGTGNKKFDNYPNILRVVLGNDPQASLPNYEDIILLETNVDDLSGEILGNLIEVLMKEGAKDVTILPGITKKNRPTNVVRIITDKSKMNEMIEKLYLESGTAGIRIQEVKRVVLNRDIITISISLRNNRFDIRVKLSKDSNGKIINVKPEFEDLKKISETTGLPLRDVMDQAIYQVLLKFN